MAALFSAIAPGAGQMYAGERRRGLNLLIIDLALVVGFLAAAVFFQGEMLKLWASLSSLSMLMTGNIILLGYRAWAASDGFGIASRASTVSFTSAVVFVGIAVWAIVLIPHAVFGYYNLVQYSLIDEVFADSETPPVADAPTSDGTVAPGVTTSTIPAPAIWDGLERLNVLLLGGDAGAGRKDIRTDTLIVVSIDPDSGETVMVSVPRNLSGIELPDGMGIWECNCFPRLINDLWIEAEKNPTGFPAGQDPGPTAVKAALGGLLGLEIQYYALVTLDGFIGIVDALGGVTIDIPVTIVDEEYPHEDGVTIESVVIEQGEQLLDGHLALAYARIRRHSDDFARMNRQRCVLGAVMDQSSPLELLANYGAIASVLKESMLTDIPEDRLVDFIDLIPKVDMENVAILHIDRDYKIGSAPGRTYYDHDRIRAETQQLIADPSSAALADGGLSLESTCT